MSTFKRLIDEASILEEIASKIQNGKEVGLSRAKIQELTENYHSWYAECLDALPNDLKEKFRQEYEGTGRWYSLPKIRKFLESPTQVNKLYNNQEGNPFSYWTYTYEDTFSSPILAQKQMLIEAEKRQPNSYIRQEAIAIIEQLARGFHSVAYQLNKRYDGRPGFQISDEYDVQDLFHAMLRPFFDDIRPEEGTPSHAGKNSRIDFLLKDELIIVEIKKTRKGLDGKKIGEELTIDKDYYRSHPDCKAFIAFVYDPDRYINNPKGLENDLSKSISEMPIKVIINQD